jgi:hypothetical protein
MTANAIIHSEPCLTKNAHNIFLFMFIMLKAAANPFLVLPNLLCSAAMGKNRLALLGVDRRKTVQLGITVFR